MCARLVAGMSGGMGRSGISSRPRDAEDPDDGVGAGDGRPLTVGLLGGVIGGGDD